jgi:hypothetical protein
MVRVGSHRFGTRDLRGGSGLLTVAALSSYAPTLIAAPLRRSTVA